MVTTILASYIINETLTVQKIIGVALGFCGVALVVSGKSSDGAGLIGDIQMFVAMMAFVIGTIFVKQSTLLVSPLVVAAYSHALASVGLLALGLFISPVWSYAGYAAPWPMVVLIFSSVVNIAIGTICWNKGVQQVGASTTSMFQSGIPVFGVFAAALFLGEELRWIHFVALLLVFSGISLGTGAIAGGKRIKEYDYEK